MFYNEKLVYLNFTNIKSKKLRKLKSNNNHKNLSTLGTNHFNQNCSKELQKIKKTLNKII